MLKDVTVHGTRLTVEDAGTGQPLLFLHGFPLNRHMWDAQLAAFAGQFRVIAPDLRGFGQSEPSADTVTMEQFADDCAALLDNLEVREPVTVIGLSMGGYIAWQFLRKYPTRVARLVACDTRAAPDTAEAAAARLKMADHVLRAGTGMVATAMLPRLFAPLTHDRSPAVVEAVHKMIVNSAPSSVAAAQHGMAIRPDARPLLATITVPTLVVCGRHDLITPPEEMRALAGEIAHAQYVELAEAGHMSPMEAPQAFNEALLNFLRSS